MLSKLLNKSAVITGAGSGLGKEIAIKAASYGMKLVLVDSNESALKSVASTLSSTGKSAQHLCLTCNVADENQMTDVGKQTREFLGAPNFVFNNAGVASGGLIWENSIEEWNWILGVNLMGVIHGIRVFTPMMLEAAKKNPSFHGRIINTASMAGLVSIPLSGMYNVSKHAVVTLSETLYQDLSMVTDQVTASVLCPFFVPTGIAASPRPVELQAASHKTPSKMLHESLTMKAVTGGKVTAENVASMVFDAIDKNQFYIFSHPKTLHSFETRAQDILNARNPSDPYGGRPEVGMAMKKALKDAYKDGGV
jgi:NAD(P)-dependent dehydrogenase (short-subunit alcohol dehydrogenase family)